MNKSFASVDRAVETFVESAIQHAVASESGDYKIANKNYSLVQKAAYYLRDNDRIDSLEKLLDRPEIGVKIAAASYLLAHNEQKAIYVLEQIANQRIPHKSFEAKLILDEYRKGNLKLY